MKVASIKSAALPSRCFVKTSDRDLVLGLFGVLAALCGLAANAASAIGQVPVVVGGKPRGDNCTSFGYQMGRVVALRHGAFLSVRAGPARKERELGRLSSGQPLFICSNAVNKDWIAIIYRQHSLDAELWECGLANTDSTAISPYRGPCKSGWVAMRYVQKSAG